MRAAVVLFVVIAVIAASTGVSAASSAQTPGAFMAHVFKEEIHDQWAQQWRELHPGHRALIPRSQYIACSRGRGTDIATGTEIFRVLDARNEPIHVRGVPQHTSKLVTIMFRRPGKANGLTYHLHAVEVGGRWTWILGGAFLSKLAHGRCLDGSLLQSTS